MKLAGKFAPISAASSFTCKSGTFKGGEDGEVVYGKPLVFTKETAGKYDF